MNQITFNNIMMKKLSRKKNVLKWRRKYDFR
ncbi:unnamed protein product [Trichobilharzia regenti]|nr:unnamed protein product [Trichobilharzia regenti]